MTIQSTASYVNILDFFVKKVGSFLPRGIKIYFLEILPEKCLLLRDFLFLSEFFIQIFLREASNNFNIFFMHIFTY